MREIDRLSFSVGDQWEDAFYASIFTRGDFRTVAAGLDGALIGYALLDFSTSPVRLRSIAIHPAYRNKGYGAALLERVIAGCKGSIDLLVDPTNAHAIQLYERLGFSFANTGQEMPARRSMRLFIE